MRDWWIRLDNWWFLRAPVPVSRRRLREAERKIDRMNVDMGRLIRALADAAKTLDEHGLLRTRRLMLVKDDTRPPA